MEQRIVNVIVDRPLGSVHPSHPDLIYPVNYGYVEGVIAPDGVSFSPDEIMEKVDFVERFFDSHVIMT